jgi:DNA-binding NarL/FixJ family response regulator
MAMRDYPGLTDWTYEPAREPPLAWKEDVDPADAWCALMQGGWTVTDHVVCAGTIVARPPSRQSSREALRTKALRVAIERASGASMKALAIDTGWTFRAVSECIANVMRTLKLRSEAELVLFFHDAAAAPGAVLGPEDGSRAAAPRHLTATRVRYGGGEHLVLTYPVPGWSLPSCLSSSEQQIVFELIAGKSQHAIARGRGTAVRTVANQVASIYRKLKVHSRVELFAALRAR